MRYVVIALTMFSFLALGGCDKLAKAFEDVQEEAPGICKKDCAEAIDCEWGEQGVDLGGDKEDSARKEAENQCVAECAWAINYGVYVVEWNDDGDEMDFNGTISGAKWEKYLKCLFNYKGCEDDYWGLDLEWDDEDDCDDYAACVEILGIDWEIEWDDDGDYCSEDGDEGIWY